MQETRQEATEMVSIVKMVENLPVVSVTSPLKRFVLPRLF